MKHQLKEPQGFLYDNDLNKLLILSICNSQRIAMVPLWFFSRTFKQKLGNSTILTKIVTSRLQKIGFCKEASSFIDTLMKIWDLWNHVSKAIQNLLRKIYSHFVSIFVFLSSLKMWEPRMLQVLFLDSETTKPKKINLS